MKLVTGNDLPSGDVVWWAGSGWSRHIAEAVDVGQDAQSIIDRESAARRVNAAYAVDAVDTGEGVRPAHIKERIRATGPSVRPDLSLPAGPALASLVK